MFEQINFLQNHSWKPLAERMRPETLDDFIGQDDIAGEESVLRMEIKNDRLSSMILWGPPGCGKTTLVHIISKMTNAELYRLSAVSDGVKEIKEVLKIGKNNFKMGVKTILFIDEIHRLNKSQQDVLLADVEAGTVILIGATTENPSFEINRALLSRTRIVVFHPLTQQDIIVLLKRAAAKDAKLSESKIRLTEEGISQIAFYSGGDARSALNNLEMVMQYYKGEENAITFENIKDVISKTAMVYDKNRDEHFQAISALHKSMRNSDPDAAVYWLARMLEAGEDPLYIARRLIRFASEDIGLACNNALQTAVAAYQAAHFLGMPECSVNLTQAVIYFSVLPKSNALYKAYELAKKQARQTSGIPVPLHLRNASTQLMADLGYGEGYQYAHDYKDGITGMKCLPEQLDGTVFYTPTDRGNEAGIKKHLSERK